jgi:NCAIR mutase (PurE)-related protein
MTPEFKVDFERGARIGLDEALFCESKTVDQVSAIVDAVQAKTGRLLLTRLDESKYQTLFARHGAQLEFEPVSRTAILGQPHGELLTLSSWRQAWTPLVSVVGGRVSRAVIALPTFVGYGVAADGATTLRAALASCGLE